MKQYICFNAGSNIFIVEPFNPKIEWHNNEFIGTFQECYLEKIESENAADRFSNCLPAIGNEDTLMNYHY